MTPPNAPQALDFAGLVAAIRQADVALAEQASRAVNVSLTLRNWFIGFYIAEFELQGADRAAYGDKLLTELASALRDQGVSNSGRRQLYGYLSFYRAYPQIVRTASALSAKVQAVPLLAEKVRTLSAQSFPVPAADPETLLNRLSYSHLEQLVELEDPLQRAFYETEALRGNWSVRELKRQIASQYFERILLCTRKNEELVEYALAGEQPVVRLALSGATAGQGGDRGLPAQGCGGVGGRG
jgi:hypothetical protein